MAMAAPAAQKQKAQNRHIVIPIYLFFAFRTIRPAHQAFILMKAPNETIGETADDGSTESEKNQVLIHILLGN